MDDDLSKLDPQVTVLSAEDFDAFLAALNQSTKPTQALIDLMKHVPAWEKTE